MGARIGERSPISRSMAPRQNQKLIEPPDYAEVGQHLAKPVAYELQTKAWAVDIGQALGYTAKRVEEWIRWYKHVHSANLSRYRKRTRIRREKVEALRQEALRREQEVLAQAAAMDYTGKVINAEPSDQ